MKKARGFTIIELMITLVLASILLAWAVPSFTRFLDRTTLTSETNNWVGVLNFARSEAITRGERVTVCRTLNPNACDGSSNCNCGVTEAPGSPPNYHTGYLIFTSTGNPQAINFRPSTADDPDVLLRAGQAQSNKVTIRGNGFADNAFSFLSDGTLDTVDQDASGNLTARHVVCIMGTAGDASTAVNNDQIPGRVVVISQTGRPRVDTLQSSDNCTGNTADDLYLGE